jgi:hypothetical protein
VRPIPTPSPDHIEFDQLCADVDEFEPLPAVKPGDLERDEDNGDEASFDDQILAGLVSPV